MIKALILKWLGINPQKVEPYIPASQSRKLNKHAIVGHDKLEGAIIAVDWYDNDKKCWTTQKFTKLAFEEIKPISVAVWDIKQFVTCPFCNWRTDVIASNINRRVNQGHDNGKDIHIVHKSDGGSYSETRDAVMAIPRPPYFGAMMEDTENLDEHIPCGGCGRDLKVKEAHWGYGE